MVSVRNPASTNFTWYSYKESFACHCVIGAKQIAGLLSLLPDKPRKQKPCLKTKQKVKKSNCCYNPNALRSLSLTQGLLNPFFDHFLVMSVKQPGFAESLLLHWYCTLCLLNSTDRLVHSF